MRLDHSRRLRAYKLDSCHVARPIGMKGFAMWVWGHRVTWGVGEVNGTVLVRWSAQEKAVRRWAFWREIRLVGLLG
nr:hypothetical protein [Tanacetum cinerariifolium]